MYKTIITHMDNNEINKEIEDLITELTTTAKSLANSREFIAENDIKRASNYLSEAEIALQAIAGRVSKIKLVL
jgi:hypothetical protein